MAKKLKLKRIGLSPRALIEVLSGYGKAGKTSVSFTDVRQGVNDRGYDLTKTDGTLMTLPELNKAVERAKSWLAEQILLDPSPGVPAPVTRQRGGRHEKPKKSQFPDDQDGKKYKAAKDLYNRHKKMVIDHIFDREDGKGMSLPLITLSYEGGRKFKSSDDLYGWLGSVSGSSGDIFVVREL